MPEPARPDPGDGITELTQRRQQRQRRAPLPPRHPRPMPTEPAVASVEPVSEPPSAEVSDVQAEAGGVASSQQPPSPPRTRRRPATSNADQQAEAVPLRLAQFYVTPDHDEALRKIRATGLIDNMDVSASAVVRHALDQLLAKHSPDELVKLLGSPKGQKQNQRGRPRR
jgi:hypothetical protein